MTVEERLFELGSKAGDNFHVWGIRPDKVHRQIIFRGDEIGESVYWIRNDSDGVCKTHKVILDYDNFEAQFQVELDKFKAELEQWNTTS